jgi:hypothetical protein
MSRAEVRKATKSETSDCDDKPTAPLECQSELFSQTVGGLEWFVTVNFIPGYGASKISVSSLATLSSELLDLFDQYKLLSCTRFG